MPPNESSGKKLAAALAAVRRTAARPASSRAGGAAAWGAVVAAPPPAGPRAAVRRRGVAVRSGRGRRAPRGTRAVDRRERGAVRCRGRAVDHGELAAVRRRRRAADGGERTTGRAADHRERAAVRRRRRRPGRASDGRERAIAGRGRRGSGGRAGRVAAVRSGYGVSAAGRTRAGLPRVLGRAPAGPATGRRALTVRGEQLRDGALPGVIGLRAHRVHRAPEGVKRPGPAGAPCAERSLRALPSNEPRPRPIAFPTVPTRRAYADTRSPAGRRGGVVHMPTGLSTGPAPDGGGRSDLAYRGHQFRGEGG